MPSELNRSSTTPPPPPPHPLTPEQTQALNSNLGGSNLAGQEAKWKGQVLSCFPEWWFPHAGCIPLPGELVQSQVAGPSSRALIQLVWGRTSKMYPLAGSQVLCKPRGQLHAPHSKGKADLPESWALRAGAKEKEIKTWGRVTARRGSGNQIRVSSQDG